ncbi:hypothetical protein JNJ66_01860 [Candidatus Saccharibacteria bacterium]|nr:hypothetical protein [Candidatus Saccharibacteria bacterium]
MTRFFEAYGSFMAGPLCNIGRVRQAFADLGLTGPDDIALAWRLMTALMPRCLRQHQCTSDEEWEAWAQRSMELRRVLLRSDEALGLAGLDQLVQDIGQWLETADLGGFEGVVAFRYLSRRLGPDQQYLLDELSRLYPASLREQCLVTTTARRLVPA